MLSSDKPLAWIKFSDAIKADAMSLVAALKHAYRVSLLTGDAKAEAQRIASALDIEDWQAEASPEDKLKQIRVYQAAGEKVLMVGDGVNDAAAMGAANTAIAVSPVDIVVQDAADATLLSQDVAMLQVLLSYAQRVRAIIKQNMVWAVLYNVSVIPLAVLGVLQPWMAALGMSFSSLLVILNANRLLYVETNIEEQD